MVGGCFVCKLEIVSQRLRVSVLGMSVGVRNSGAKITTAMVVGCG